MTLCNVFKKGYGSHWHLGNVSNILQNRVKISLYIYIYIDIPNNK